MSVGNSRAVFSAQTEPHRDLEAILERHLRHPFRKPIADYNRAACDQALAAWRAWRPESGLILDAGCGVGWSTVNLAHRFPASFVLGVDQSAHRLGRERSAVGDLPANAALVRADLVDFWRLLAAQNIRLERHFLLYPNPWPKIGHLARRWHGHAVFPVLRQLGGDVECRSNWRLYIEEMALALGRLAGRPVRCEPWVPPLAITPFERKYLESGHSLWRCQVQL